MAQKKKTTTVKKAKKATKKITTTIVKSIIPNYSSGQFSGHKNNNNVSFVPQQRETTTDNVVGELIGRLVSKIENDGNKQTQEYTKEIQPINNNNYVNVYNNEGKGTTTTESSGSSGGSSDVGTKITDSITDKTIDKSVDYGVAAIGGGIVAGAGAIAGAIYNRKALGQGIKNLFKKGGGEKLGGTAQSSRLQEELNPILENAPTRTATTRNTRQRIPKGYHEQVPTNPELTPVQPETQFSRRIEEAGGTGMRPPRQSLSRSTSSSSNYGSLIIQEEFGSTTPSQIRKSEPVSTVTKRTDRIKQQLVDLYSPATRTPALNSEERKFVERTLRNQSLDPSNLSPVNQDILRSARASAGQRTSKFSFGTDYTFAATPASPDMLTRARSSAIQQHNGVSTRNIRAQTQEPHAQLTQQRGRGRPRTRPLGPQPQPNPRGRPRTSTLSQAPTVTPNQRASVARNVTKTGNK